MSAANSDASIYRHTLVSMYQESEAKFALMDTLLQMAVASLKIPGSAAFWRIHRLEIYLFKTITI